MLLRRLFFYAFCLSLLEDLGDSVARGSARGSNRTAVLRIGTDISLLFASVYRALDDYTAETIRLQSHWSGSMRRISRVLVET
jgi:hypothetical protein